MVANLSQPVVVKSEPQSENDTSPPNSRSSISPTTTFNARRPRDKDMLEAGGDPKRVRLDANHNDRWR